MKKLLLFTVCSLVFFANQTKAQFQTYTSGNLQVDVSFNGQHDSTYCQSQGIVFYNITKQNSLMLDSVSKDINQELDIIGEENVDEDGDER